MDSSSYKRWDYISLKMIMTPQKIIQVWYVAIAYCQTSIIYDAFCRSRWHQTKWCILCPLNGLRIFHFFRHQVACVVLVLSIIIIIAKGLSLIFQVLFSKLYNQAWYVFLCLNKGSKFFNFIFVHVIVSASGYVEFICRVKMETKCH